MTVTDPFRRARLLRHRSPHGRRGTALIVVLLVGLVGPGCGPESDPPAAAAPVRPEGELVDVAVPARDHAIVVSADGAIHVSRDGGRSWLRARSPGVRALAAVSMVDARIGWAVGPGVILRTDDGGRRWRRQRLPGRAEQLALHGVAARDAEHAIAWGRGDERLHTRDGGGSWQRVDPGRSDQPEGGSTPMPIRAVDCVDSGRCLAVGPGIEVVSPEQKAAPAPARADALGLPPFGFRFGASDLAPEAAERIAEAVRAHPRNDSLEARIEILAGRAEIDRIGLARDPSALFELIEARAEEVRAALEAGGLRAEAIAVIDPPPWGFEELLDDDPGLLDRYWVAIRSETPATRIEVLERVALRAVALDGSGRAVAVGRSGVFIESDAPFARWGGVERLSPHDLHGVALVGAEILVVGAQGGFFRSRDGGARWSRVEPDATGDFFDDLNAVAIDPEGESAVVVGAAGRLFVRSDRAGRWQPADSSTSASDPIIR